MNKANGCIYLGTISDLTSGPFAPVGTAITRAQKAFWERVNQQGGIGGHDIDVTTYVRDNKYNPEIHNQAYQEIKGNVLALAQTLGSPTTAAIIGDLRSSKIVSVPASNSSAWAFEDVIVESGTSYCFEGMNAVDYAVDELQVKSVMAVHLPGDFGDDAAAGVKVAAEAHNLPFTDVQTRPGQDNQAGAIDAIVSTRPDLVVLTTSPADAAVIVGQAVARGYPGRFIGSSATWNPTLLKGPAAEAFTSTFLQSHTLAPFHADTPGHRAMREALGDVQASDWYVAGWALSYPLKAALQKATASGPPTRDGLLEAAKSLNSVDYEGMWPAGAGKYAGIPNDAALRETLINKIDEAAPTGVSTIKQPFVGPTARGYRFDKPCFQKG